MSERPIHGRQLTAARAALGLSMDEVGELAGVHVQSVFNAEHRGRRLRAARCAAKIGHALAGLGVSFETRPGGGCAVVFEPDFEKQSMEIKG